MRGLPLAGRLMPYHRARLCYGHRDRHLHRSPPIQGSNSRSSIGHCPVMTVVLRA